MNTRLSIKYGTSWLQSKYDFNVWAAVCLKTINLLLTKRTIIIITLHLLRYNVKQMALNRSHELCLKLTYMHLLKAGRVPGDTCIRAMFGPSGIIRTNLVEVY